MSDRTRGRPPADRARADSAAGPERVALPRHRRRRGVHRRRDRRRRARATRLDPAAAPLTSPLTVGSMSPASDVARELVVFIASRTGQMVKRAAVGAEGFVLDHYSRPRSTPISRASARACGSAFAAADRRSRSSATASRSTTRTGRRIFPPSSSARRGYDLLASPARAGAGDEPKAADDPPRLGSDADRDCSTALHRAAAAVGGRARHEAARADLRHAAGVHVERDDGRSARRRRRRLARPARDALGGVRESHRRRRRDVRRDVDVAALACLRARRRST